MDSGRRDNRQQSFLYPSLPASGDFPDSPKNLPPFPIRRIRHRGDIPAIESCTAPIARANAQVIVHSRAVARPACASSPQFFSIYMTIFSALPIIECARDVIPTAPGDLAEVFTHCRF
ncbi:hypothetical protein [Burkholderia sp. RF2-non_BP3]|uniref:hypothetical protein n=1 Tax=Burkholderia sp. RF2-non_BP3 TaxID=1637844 RepID=UPI000ACB705C|nr:hypothetical protein [Burkholderia sp. RF2-non_BP3]